MLTDQAQAAPPPTLEKVPSGIAGLDEIMDGGFPRNRPALVVGSAGAGKTVLAMQFLLRGALDYGEPGIFMSFEESEEELTQNFASLDYNLPDLIQRNLLRIDSVRVERSEIEETGEY